jgi:hypothetical protein
MMGHLKDVLGRTGRRSTARCPGTCISQTSPYQNLGPVGFAKPNTSKHADAQEQRIPYNGHGKSARASSTHDDILAGFNTPPHTRSHAGSTNLGPIEPRPFIENALAGYLCTRRGIRHEPLGHLAPAVRAVAENHSVSVPERV